MRRKGLNQEKQKLKLYESYLHIHIIKSKSKH
jgi:hypothetical protein